jgi:hypothetical protein
MHQYFIGLERAIERPSIKHKRVKKRNEKKNQEGKEFIVYNRPAPHKR